MRFYKCTRKEIGHENKVYLTTAKYNNMNRTQPHHFLYQLIGNILRCKANVAKGELRGIRVGVAWGYVSIKIRTTQTQIITEYFK